MHQVVTEASLLLWLLLSMEWLDALGGVFSVQAGTALYHKYILPEIKEKS